MLKIKDSKGQVVGVLKDEDDKPDMELQALQKAVENIQKNTDKGPEFCEDLRKDK